MEKELGNRGPLLKHVLNGRWIKYVRRGEDAPHLLVHLLYVDSLIELDDNLIILCLGQFTPKTIELKLRILMLLEQLCALSCLNSWITVILDPLSATRSHMIDPVKRGPLDFEGSCIRGLRLLPYLRRVLVLLVSKNLYI